MIRIATCSGFYGDRLSAAKEMVEGGPIDALTGDWLAELTMLILARTQAKRPGSGFARTFVTQMEQVMGTCLDRGITVVSNAGGLDPAGCADQLAEVADRLGLSPRIAYVDGDDLMPRIGELADSGALSPFGSSALPDIGGLVSANAYLGCWGIVEALDAGADIVVTGRVTDAAVVCGPAAHHHGWGREDHDALAGAVVAGHVIECSAQATGGNYSFFEEIPGLEHVGFPWAEVAADGSSVIGKHDGAGGAVTVGTVTSQILYEIAGPAYLGPDVVSHFDTIEVEQLAADRVRISGVRGTAPTGSVKVAMNELGGYRNDLVVALTGLDVEAKAEVALAAFWDACPHGPDDFASCTTRVVRREHADPESNEAATAELRISVKDPDERRVGRAFSNAMVETALASIPGMYLLSGGPSAGQAYGVYRPALVPADLVPQYVHFEGRTTVVDTPSGGGETREGLGASEPPPSPAVTATRPIPIGRLIGTRSGDKGGDANLGVFTRDDSVYAWVADWLDVDRLRSLLPEIGSLPVERHLLPRLRAMNFVIRGLLEEGVAASTRGDAQATSLGEWVRARVVEVPVDLIDS